MTLEELFVGVLRDHAEYAMRCDCGWRAIRGGRDPVSYLEQYEAHLAAVLVAALGAEKIQRVHVSHSSNRGFHHDCFADAYRLRGLESLPESAVEEPDNDAILTPINDAVAYQPNDAILPRPFSETYERTER